VLFSSRKLTLRRLVKGRRGLRRVATQVWGLVVVDSVRVELLAGGVDGGRRVRVGVGVGGRIGVGVLRVLLVACGRELDSL
jgi:hypothetical protein